MLHLRPQCIGDASRHRYAAHVEQPFVLPAHAPRHAAGQDDAGDGDVLLNHGGDYRPGCGANKILPAILPVV